MHDLRMVLHEIGWEQKLFWRNPGAALFTVFFPPLFLLAAGMLFGNWGHLSFLSGDPVPVLTYLVPAMIGFGVISACYTTLGIQVVMRRDQGLLKRKRATPLPAWAAIAGMTGSSVLTALLLSVLVLAIGWAVFGVRLPVLGLVVLVPTLIFGCVLFCSLGIALASAIPTSEAAPAVINVVLFPLLFLSGTFMPVSVSWVNTVADIFPIRHFTLALLGAFTNRPAPWAHLAVMGLWLVIGLGVAVKMFRWESTRN